MPNKFHEILPKLLRPPAVTCNTKNKNTVLNRQKIGYVLVIRIRHIPLFRVKKSVRVACIAGFSVKLS